MLKQLAPIGTAAFGMEWIWIATYGISPLREHTWSFVGLMSSAFLLCLLSYFRLVIPNRKAACFVVACGILFRLTILPANPDQSEDVYRYLWDGKIASAGVDPYRYPPQAPELTEYRDSELYPKLNSLPYRSVYPPVSQLLFRASYELFGSRILPIKAVFSILEVSSLLLAWKLLAVYGCSLQSLYLLAWNPLFIFEFSHSGHSDSGMMFLTLLSVYLLHLAKNSWALVSHAGSILTKLYPALCFPLYARLVGWRSAGIGIATGLAIASLYFTPESFLKSIGALGVYFRPFEFNAGIHYLAGGIGRVFFHASWNQVTGPYLGAAALLISVAIALRFPVRESRDILHAGFWIMTAVLCLATTVHPWYLSWAALALPVFPYAFMTYWTGASFLSYIAYQVTPPQEKVWVLLVQYVPLYLLMILEIRRGGPLLPSWAERGRRSLLALED